MAAGASDSRLELDGAMELILRCVLVFCGAAMELWWLVLVCVLGLGLTLAAFRLGCWWLARGHWNRD